VFQCAFPFLLLLLLPPPVAAASRYSGESDSDGTRLFFFFLHSKFLLSLPLSRSFFPASSDDLIPTPVPPPEILPADSTVPFAFSCLVPTHILLLRASLSLSLFLFLLASQPIHLRFVSVLF
jgi:hypothetical protein